MKFLVSASVICLLTAFTAPHLCGESIGISFTGGSEFLQPFDQPGIVDGANWNNVSGGSQTNIALNNSSGSPLPTRLTYTSTRESTGYGTTNTANAATNQLYRGNITGNNLGGEVIVSIDNIPYSRYDVYVFASQAYTANTLSIADGLTTFYYRGDGQPLDGATSLTQTTSEDPNAPTVGRANYQVFRNHANSSFSIATGGSINGIVSNNVFGLHIVSTEVQPAQLPSVISVGTNPNNGHTYALLSESSWEEAEAKAQELGGHLATIRNQNEQDWLWDRWGGSNVTLWIGLHNPTQDNTNWQWSSGESVTFTSWGSGEPTHTHEVYVEMHWQKQGRWNDTASNVITTRGIVEFTSPTAVMTPSSNPPPASSTNAPVVFASTISSDGTFQFDIAAPEIFDELTIEVSSDLFDWHHLITMPVSTVPTTIKELRQGDPSRFYRVAIDRSAANGRLTWPLPTGGPYTSRCVAIIDHSPTGDGQVVAYNGEVASGAPYEYAPGIIGYPKAGGGSFQLPLINYDDEVAPVSDDTYLFYDGHRGYDFPATRGTDIKAAAGGDLFAATDNTDGSGGGIWRNPLRAARLASITYSWDTYMTFYIIHPSGLSTWYLHADALAPKVLDEIAANGFAEVQRGDVIGFTGDTGTPGSYHLHFSSRRTTGTSIDGEFISEIADPYGDGSEDHANVLWDKSPTSN